MSKPEATVAVATAAGRAVASGVSAIYTAVAGDPLGIRLNNPGNIEINSRNRWAGDVVRPHNSGTPTDTTAAVFFSIRKVGGA